MNVSEQLNESPKQVPHSSRKLRQIVFWFLRLVLGGLILAGSLYWSYIWLANPPRSQRRPTATESTLVETEKVYIGSEPVIVRAMGTVIPARETRLAVQVPGKITHVDSSFIPGGVLRAGDMLVEIEAEDYQIALKQQEANVARAQASLKLEMGQQAVARQEYELIGKSASAEDEELLLRQPQLMSAKATLEGAMAALEKAKLDLARTVVRAPYNCIVQTRLADLGGYVSPGTPIATIIGTDVFWVEVSVGVGDLQWLDIPNDDNQKGSFARIYYQAAWGSEEYREGNVIRLLPNLDEGRMARLLVAVSDPLDLEDDSGIRRPLILNSFLRLDLYGKELHDVAKLPRRALREGGVVWVMNPEHKLEIRAVSIVWSNDDFVFVEEGIQHGDNVVVSDLTTPVPGMLLRTKGKDAEPGGSGKTKNSENSL